MYDPSAPTLVIRLAEVGGRTIGHLAMERADILTEMEALNRRLIEVDALLDSNHAQAQPIPASAVMTDNDFWTCRHRVMTGPAAKVARVDGAIEHLHEDDGA